MEPQRILTNNSEISFGAMHLLTPFVYKLTCKHTKINSTYLKNWQLNNNENIILKILKKKFLKKKKVTVEPEI